MKAQHPRARILRLKIFTHDVRPHASGGAKLCDLFQKIGVRVEKERQARSEVVHVESRFDGGLYVSHAITQRECNFLHSGGAGLPHVVARDGN